MKTRIFNMLWLIALSTPIGAKAQHTIQGKVTNQEGEVISGAKVILSNSYQINFTNSDGSYQVSDLKNGDYTLQVSSEGYESQQTPITIAGKDVVQNIVLIASAILIEEINVQATRADEKTPTTYTNLSKSQIGKSNFGQDLPYLLEGTPSTVVTSDAGGGVGYTGIRIRGVDPTRTNVTINGIPVNDGESHGVFWVNMPDFASSVESIQIQRGVGTSSNGSAAFGSSINIQTDQINRKAYGELDNAYGSFNTLRTTLKAGTGILNNRFTIDTRLSRISSDGYVDRGSSNLKSFYISGAWIGKKSLIRANVFSGKEITYQAWYGTPESVIKGDVAGMNAYADRNGLTEAQRQNLLNSGRKYNFYTYENETDNYQQDHYQLHFTHTFSSKLNLNVSGHYTRGRGYYEQFRANDDFATYNFTPVILGGDTITETDVIRRRWLDNHFYGMVFSANYAPTKQLKITWGGSANRYEGDHFGEVIWARMASTSNIGDRYYENSSAKTDVNSYIKSTYKFKKFTTYADVQVRNIQYSFLGIDNVGNEIKDVQQTVNYTFFNPKAGFMYDFNYKNNAYASISVANREPVRDDFREATPANRPKHETLYNAEAGYRRKSNRFFTNANAYLMYYNNQLILTGQINDVGGYPRTNVDKSYRAGIELEAGFLITKKWSVTANATFSQNKIVEFNEYIDNYDNYDANGNMIQTVIQHRNTDLAFSPNFIASGAISYEPMKNLNINWMTKMVGDQFLDNTSSQARKIDRYITNNISINYSIQKLGFEAIQISLLANNIFNYMYVSNGYTFGYISGGERTTENFYYPQAGRNFLARLTFKI
ncbi:MAG: TonB-dependent receptor [Crocinitomicaceae bacterium]|nr:MAG: TonB-dependent receptor [Crocinitomicaceae bacterium]